jgi:hypothetical protein
MSIIERKESREFGFGVEDNINVIHHDTQIADFVSTTKADNTNHLVAI